MIELSDKVMSAEPITIRKFRISLNKEDMLQILQSDGIIINGDKYKVPEDTLLKFLLNNIYGGVRLSLEVIKDRQ